MAEGQLSENNSEQTVTVIQVGSERKKVTKKEIRMLSDSTL